MRWIPGASVLALQRDPLVFFTELARRRSEPARFRLGPYRFHVVTTPELADEVYLARHGSLAKGIAMQRAKAMLGDGLLTSEAPLHLRERRALQPAFQRRNVTAYSRVIVDEARSLAEQWPNGATVDIADEMARLALRIVVQTLFAARIEPDEADELVASVDGVVQTFDAATVALSPLLLRLPLPRTRRFLEARARLDAVIARLIVDGRTAGPGRCSGEPDILSLLSSDGRSRDDNLVRDELVTLLLAGYETVAYALTWTFHLLAEHPAIEERLHAELDAALEDRDAGADDLGRLVYTRQVIAESLRLYPPSWVNSRRALEEFELGGEHVRRGDNLVVVVYLVHRDPRHWPDPERFDPARFAPGHERGRHRTAYIPFGAGLRRCIGRDYAWLETILVVATLARRWRLRRLTTQPVVLLPRFTLRPAGGMPMRLERRAGL